MGGGEERERERGGGGWLRERERERGGGGGEVDFFYLEDNSFRPWPNLPTGPH